MVLHECPHCDYKTTISSHFKRHKARHAPRSAIHVCADCGKGFVEAEKFVRHRATHSPRKQIHVCTYHPCEYRTSRRDTLLLHITRNHTPDPDAMGRYVCLTCGYRTKRADLFARHRKHYLTEGIYRPYKCVHPCPSCHRSYPTAEKLGSHRVDHVRDNAPDTYRCGTCDFSTVYAVRMREHVKLCPV